METTTMDPVAKLAAKVIEAATSTEIATASPREKMLALRAALNACVLERADEIDSLLTCALAGEHCVLIGPPGTAKSYLARAFSRGVGSTYFEQLLTRFSTPEELFGPFSLTGLQNDRYRRAMEGRLPTAEVAFVDEIFKAGPGLLNALLAALNERIVHDDGQAKKIPLRVCLAASNEYPSSEETGALWDRFLVRHQVTPLSSMDSQLKLAMGQAKEMPHNLLTIAEWDAAVLEADAVKVTTPVMVSYLKLIASARAAGCYVSDRRMLSAIKLLKAAAYLDNASEVDSEHFGILAHVLWPSIEKRDEVKAIVQSALSPQLADAQKIFDAVMAATAPLRSSDDASNQARALSEIKRASDKLKNVGQQMRKGSRGLERVRSMFKQLSDIHKEVLTKAAQNFEPGGGVDF